MRAAIVLAAGAGSRFGGGKLLAPYKHGRLIDGALRCAFAAPADQVIVVTGFDADGVSDAARRHAENDAKIALRLVHAPDYAEGMAASLRAAFLAVPEDADSAFVFLADMPEVPAGLATVLADAIGARAAAAPSFEGRRGHPVLFNRRLFPSLTSLRGDQGARRLLDGLGDDLALIRTDDAGVLFDVDTKADLGR